MQGHQLQLQQRLQALQLQIAKQNWLLESARGTPSPRSPAQRYSPSKDAIQMHNSLKLAEDRAQEAELKLTATERELAQLKRWGSRLAVLYLSLPLSPFSWPSGLPYVLWVLALLGVRLKYA
jgi:hypothetical protein